MLPVIAKGWCERACRVIEVVQRWLHRCSALCVLLLVALTAQQVVARYFFQSSSIALQELQWHGFALIFLLALGHTWQIDRHVRVDIFYGRFSPVWRRRINFLGIVCFALPLVIVVVHQSLGFVQQSLDYSNPRPADYYTSTWLEPNSPAYAMLSWAEGLVRSTLWRGEISADPGGLEGRWLIKAAIPFGMLTLALEGLRQLLGGGAREF